MKTETTTRPARLVIRNRTYDHFFGNLKEYDLVLKGGTKGTGNTLWSCRVWANGRSEEEANKMLYNWLQEHPEIEVIPNEEKE